MRLTPRPSVPLPSISNSELGAGEAAGNTMVPPLVPPVGKYINPKLTLPFSSVSSPMALTAEYKPHCSKPKFLPGSLTVSAEHVKAELADAAAELSTTISTFGFADPLMPP